MAPFQKLVRPTYFYGKLLSAEDFTQEQQYFLDRMRRQNRFLHGWGIVAGLNVSLDGGSNLVVEPGLAIDCRGNELVLDTREILSTAALKGPHYVVLRYEEIPVDEKPAIEGDSRFSAVRESARVELLRDNPEAGHRGMEHGTPGCGQAHPLCLALVSLEDSGWRVAPMNRRAKPR
jgi:hypothetical protein